MPHGRLTPLGRQLRSVLASLRPASTCSHHGRRACTLQDISINNTSGARARGLVDPARGICHAPARLQSVAAVAVAQDDTQEDERKELYRPIPLASEDDEAHGIGRLAGIEEAEPFTGRRQYENTLDVRQSEPTSGRNLNVSLRQGKEYPMYYRNNSPTVELRLEEIMHSYIKREALKGDTTESGLADRQLAMLESKGYGALTIKTWADVVTSSSFNDSAVQLERLQKTHDANVPLFVLFHMLRKPYINSRTLGVLLRVSITAVKKYERELEEGINKEDLFTLFTLLLRRTRDVWPAAMESLVDMLLQYVPSKTMPDQNSTSHEYRLASLGFRLNKAMRLLAVPTSVNPYKSLNIQETCIIRILRFLAEHDPPLEINRDGFRAVILMQLAQPKSESDRLWAELKSLAWPPWKEDRTAMDADITAAEQGRSKAAETLERMREAGFAPYEWERVAAIYAGWDTDRTPTIQTRVLFSSGKKRFASGAAVWVARISTTRTIQEAWACYLAYEDQTSEYDQDVCLAMFRKLYEEDARVQNTRKYMRLRTSRKRGELWPGDAIEIEPPPPSSHQHTYTRTAPPSMAKFYRQLRAKGVVFEGHCLAFLVSRANTLQQGLDHLLASKPAYPNIHHLLNAGSTHDLSDVPDSVLGAFMELLGRFSNLSLAKALPAELEGMKRAFANHVSLGNLHCNPDHPLVHAIRVLSHRLPHSRRPWHSILRALGNSSSHEMLSQALVDTDTTPISRRPQRAHQKQPEQNWRAAYTARRLVLRVMGLMRSIQLEIDAISFTALCNVAENFAVSFWMEMRQRALKNENVDPDLESARKMLKPKHYPRYIKLCFSEFVGDEGTSAKADDNNVPNLPLLVETPSPATLHAYIRALGWMGDYPGMLEVVQWMRKHQSKLQERLELDRNGKVMMRHAIVALRVFLERSWIAQLSKDVDGRDRTEWDDLGSQKSIKRDSMARCDRFDVSGSQEPLRRLQTAAERRHVEEVQALVESVEEWNGWPTDEEVHDYCQHERFQQFNS